MGKPSIFSNQYDKKMKGRKRRNIILVTTIAIALIVVVGKIYVDNWYKNNSENYNNAQTDILKPQASQKPTTDDKASAANNNQSNNKQEDNKKEDNKPITDQKMSINMPDGDVLKLTYLEANGVKQIKNVVSTNNPSLYYNINPSGSKAIVLNSSQDMFIIDRNGTITNITKDNYITTKGKTIEKKAYLKRKPGFMWHSTPKFVSENLVVYVSQMPWFKTKKYVWKLDITNQVHSVMMQASSEDLNLNEITDKGLAFNIDGKTNYIDAQGNIIE